MAYRVIRKAEKIGSSSGVSNLQPLGRMQLPVAVNAAQHKIIDSLKTWDFFVIRCHNVFNG